jgi:hypothetical protein
MSVFSRELEQIYCVCHNHRRKTSISDLPMGIQMKSIRQYIPESLKKINAYVIITNGNILTEYFCQHISSGNFFLSAYFPSIKPLVFFY